MAERYSIEGQLDATRFDSAQVACFELAWAQAKWEAAAGAIDPLPGMDPANVLLGRLFAVEVLPEVRAHLDMVCDVLDLPPAFAPLEFDWLRRLRRRLTGGTQLESAGRWVLEHESEIGRLPLSDELELMRDQFERFALRHVAPLAGAIHRQNLLVPEEILGPLREMGLFGLSIPECWGGTASSVQDDLPMIVATEALSEASLGAAGSLITRPEILARALLAGGPPEQKQRWLPRIARGDPLCAIAITEPDAGSDVAALRLRGTPASGGWVLDGSKTWCTFAGKAALLLVAVRTDPDRAVGHRGLSLMLVEKPSSEGESFEVRQERGGSLRGKAIPTLGYRGMHSFEMSFEAFFVPHENVLGGITGLGQGFRHLMAGMAGGRLQTAARACGVMRAALRAGARCSLNRSLFGTSLAGLPLTRVRLARSAARYVAARRMTYRAAQRSSSGAWEQAVQASLAKLFTCRSAEIITRDMQQLHGGMGYAEETPAARYFVDARVLSIFEGSEETLAIRVIARDLLEKALGRGKRARG